MKRMICLFFVFCMMIGTVSLPVVTEAAGTTSASVDVTVSEDGKMFLVYPQNVQKGATVLLALYQNKALVGFRKGTYQGDEVIFENITQSYDNSKVMIWDGITSMEPVCVANKTPDVKKTENIFIMGDSYSTFADYIPAGYKTYYKEVMDSFRPQVTNVNWTWWKLLAKEMGYKIVMNDSYSGSTICTTHYTTTPLSSCFVKRLDRYIADGYFQKNPIDTFFIFGGTNDDWNNSPLGLMKYDNFTEEDLKSVFPAFCYTLSRIQEVCPKAKIVVIVNTDLKSSIGENFAIACQNYGAECVRLKNISKTASHPTVLGMEQIATQIATQLRANQ